jgi:DNA primase
MMNRASPISLNPVQLPIPSFTCESIQNGLERVRNFRHELEERISEKEETNRLHDNESKDEKNSMTELYNMFKNEDIDDLMEDNLDDQEMQQGPDVNVLDHMSSEELQEQLKAAKTVLSGFQAIQKIDHQLKKIEVMSSSRRGQDLQTQLQGMVDKMKETRMNIEEQLHYYLTDLDEWDG